ncbi:hypothetical protein L1987_83602 [Smallanthus sonchifolius]|uniref:Uncharacterized protein n=1 Tax=Smallanthus sonchifolius TaxID=185202 RepID=A0ACB8YBR6_9ASTR|nr:hypothetical protein L1987_83602 [Smallanthus sonchifolius]
MYIAARLNEIDLEENEGNQGVQAGKGNVDAHEVNVNEPEVNVDVGRNMTDKKRTKHSHEGLDDDIMNMTSEAAKREIINENVHGSSRLKDKEPLEVVNEEMEEEKDEKDDEDGGEKYEQSKKKDDDDEGGDGGSGVGLDGSDSSDTKDDDDVEPDLF